MRGPVAVLVLHSHRDKSFLDDVGLHRLSGDLRTAGIASDVVVALVTPTPRGPDPGALARLANALAGYASIAYERVWDPAIVVALRAALPDATLVQLVGEHAIEGAPADVVCTAAELVERACADAGLARPSALPYAPNLAPRYVSDDARPAFPSFRIVGANGCPYRAEARKNPLYEGVALPSDVGPGCAFCVTGKSWEHQPTAVALDRTLTQLRYVRAHAPELRHLVLHDQSPFHYLTELVEAAEREKLGPFTLLVESRADWFLQNEARFTRALEAARRGQITIAPYLVGVENFSQRELDRFNKGIVAETNVRFLDALVRWRDRYAPALDLSHGAFGFVLFTPWTTLEDLRENLEGIRKTRLHRFRGRFLLSRARLYPDTALYYLAQRDGLLAPEFARAADDASARYGYLPAHPFRFADPHVARIAALAPDVLERRGGKDELCIFEALLDTVGAATDPGGVSVDDVALAVERIASARVDRAKADIARTLVGADALPTPLRAGSLELFDVELSPSGVALVIGDASRLARIRIALGDVAPSARVDAPRADASFRRVLDAMADRVVRASVGPRSARARELLGDLFAS